MALIVNRMLEFVFKRPWLRPYAMAYGQWYRNLSGYRKLGLRLVLVHFSAIARLYVEALLITISSDTTTYSPKKQKPFSWL